MKDINKRTQEAIARILPNSIYFAHPVNYYEGSNLNTHGTVESTLEKSIKQYFPYLNIFNPNQDFNQDNYFVWKEEFGNGMKYYFDVILPEMIAVVGLPFKDGMIGAGVAGELTEFTSTQRLSFEINHYGKITSISELAIKNRRLSIEETRRRVYGD